MRICSDRPGACYGDNVCAKKVLGVCVKKEYIEDYIDDTIPENRQKLIDLGFKFMKVQNP